MVQKTLTHALKAIEKRIKEKSDLQISFQDYQEHTDYDAYMDYDDCHGDYYDFDKY